MRFRIHYEVTTGEQDTFEEDSFDISGGTLEEIREKAGHELFLRGGQNPWSEEIK